MKRMNRMTMQVGSGLVQRGMCCALAAGLLLTSAPASSQTMNYGVNDANAGSSASHPFTIVISTSGGDYTVHVSNLKKGDKAVDKAKKIADAVNNDDHAGPRIFATDNHDGTITLAPIIDYQHPTGKVTQLSNPNDPSKEKLDKLSMTNSSSGGFGWTSDAQVAAGIDPDGLASVVSMGIAGVYVSEITPDPGMPVELVFESLANDLNAHGIAVTLDLANRSLQLNNVLTPGVAFGYGNTDVGLDTSGWIAEAVPEPGSLALLGLGALAGLRRRRVG